MQLRSFTCLSLFATVCATPLLAQQSWPHFDRTTNNDVRQDESGHRTSVVRPRATHAPAPQQSNFISDWQSLGPFGGDIDDVQVSPQNPNIVLAGLAPSSGGAGALYRSLDGGGTWAEVPELSGKLVHDIAFASTGVAYLGTIDGVWKSADGIGTFTAQNLGIGLNDQVLDVDVDRTFTNTVWIGIADALGNQPVHVMVSTNAGLSWTDRSPLLPSSLSCTAIAINPVNSNEIYAGFAGFGGGGAVWVSTNGGLNWTDRSAGLPARPVNDIEHDGARVLVAGGQLFGSQTFGLYSSPNLGVSWTPLHDGSWPNLVIHDIAVSLLDPNLIHVATAGAGVFRSTNGGASWSFSVGGTAGLSVNAVNYWASNPSLVFLGSSSVAVWRSNDAGLNFVASSTGIGALDVFSIDSNPMNGNELAIAFQGLNNGGVYTSLDAGATWALAALPGTRFNQVRFSPQGVLYAISDGPTTIGAEALYRRTGSSWTSIGPNQGPQFESELFGMRVSATDPLFIVAVGADFGVAGAEPTVWRTTNGGGMWTKVYEGATANRPIQDVLTLTLSSDTHWLASYVDYTGGNAGGVLRSTSSAVTWVPSNTGFPALMQGYSISESVVGSKVYVANGASPTSNGVYQTLDGGLSWTPTGFVGQVFEVQAARFELNQVFIAQAGPVRVSASVDSGATFTPYATGLPAGEFPRDLQAARGAGDPSLHYCGTKGSYSAFVLWVPRAYCFGDGTDTACPCAPPSPAGTGCLNSFGTGGVLAGNGSNSVSSDSFVLTASGLPPSTPTLFFQGTAQQNFGDGSVFGDGLRCAAGTVVRLGTHPSSGGVVSYPIGADLPVSVRGLIPAGGGVRYYQAWYRNAASFCTVSTFNLTSGLEVSWAP